MIPNSLNIFLNSLAEETNLITKEEINAFSEIGERSDWYYCYTFLCDIDIEILDNNTTLEESKSVKRLVDFIKTFI